MRKLFTATAIAATMLTSAANAAGATEAERELAVKLTLHQIVCGGQSDSTMQTTIKFVVKAGGIEKIAPAVLKLKADIKRDADLSSWCELMDNQIEMVTSLRARIKE
jgi:hypothetical protein